MAIESDKVKTEELQTVAPAEPTVTPLWRRVPKWGWAVGALLVFFAFIGVLAACFSAVRFAARSVDGRNVLMTRGGMMQRLNDDQLGQYGTGLRSVGGFGGRMMGSMGTNSNTRVSGVVTAVDGNNLTVAGNGTTTKVTVSDSTTYSGSSKPAAVNDTIVVTGAKASDGSFTAAAVYLSRQ